MDEISADGLFTVSEVECLGACVNAPMMQVNNEWFYEDLTPENTKSVLDQFKRGEEPKVGPQIDRNFSQGPLEKTSLINPENINSTFERDFAGAKKEWEEARAKAAAAAAAAKK